MTTAPYAKWAENYAVGMAASAAAVERMRPIAKERARAQSAAARANRAEGQTKRRCIVPHCKFVWHKGRLCRKHWSEVPQDAKVALMIDTMEAQRKVAAKHHRRMERDLLAKLAPPKDTP